MFGVLPLIRGLLIGAAALGAIAIALVLASLVARALLKRVGIDWAELRAYQERRRIHLDQLRQLESQLPALKVDSEQFEQAARTLQAFQEAAPEPPAWAFWLRRGA